ncbi:MAG: acyl-CoA desaturase [Saprospirales bacterium]|nr:MAG: acyl-CoA desaturase [Saprospirales bacterium]
MKKAVSQYFKEKGIHQKGNWRLYLKSTFFLLLLPTLYLTLLFAGLPVWINFILWAMIGLTLAGIGFNIMHDASHGSFSTHPRVNRLFTGTLDLMGGCGFIWKQKHGVNHHTFTNIEGLDDDLDIQPWIRTNVNQKKFWFHKYQHYYSIVLYSMTYLLWVFVQDYRKYFSGRIGTTRMKKMRILDHIYFWAGKTTYLTLFIVLPVLQLGLFQALVGYLIAAMVCGLLLAIVFQLAHLVEDTQFPLPDSNNKIENDWMIHQLQTTANFCTQNKLISWFTGGLNFQVEHHLFPGISHVHYPAINKLTRNICAEFNIPYYEYQTFNAAFRSHLSHLKVVGRFSS